MKSHLHESRVRRVFPLAASRSARHFRPMQNAVNLTGHLLIAMPGMRDARFERAVVFLCMHSDEGAMGLLINKPTRDIRFSDLLTQLDIPFAATRALPRLHHGGPVETERGFVLHSGLNESQDENDNGSLKVNDTFTMTASRDILRDIATATGPARVLPALGYTGWGPGQLESELQQNAWLTCEGAADLVFAGDNTQKWQAALGQLGISPLMLSAEGGRA